METFRKIEQQKKKKLDVLMISAVYDPPQIGGVASHVAWLAGALSKLTKSASSRKLSCQVHVITGSPHDYSGGRFLTIKRFWGKDKEDKEDEEDKEDKAFTLPSSLPLAAQFEFVLGECKNIKPDVIHAHDFESAYIGMMLKTAIGVPLVVTIHKTPKELDSTSPKSDAKECFMKLMMQSGLVDMYIAPSKEYLKPLVGHRIPKSKRRLIYHGIPANYLATFQKELSVFQRFNLDPKDLFILCPARLDYHKGIHTLIEGVRLLQDKQLLKGYKYVVAGGTGKGWYRNQLVKLIADYGLDDIVKLGPKDGGDCSPNEMKALYLGAEACVLPSVREGFGQALLEAFVYMTPVLAANTGGIPEVITPGYTGYLFNRGEPDKLAKQLCQLLREKKETRVMVVNARKMVGEKFSAGRMAEEYLRLYLEVSKISLR